MVKTKSKKHKTVKICSIVICVILVVLIAASMFLYNFAFVISSPVHMTKLMDMNAPSDEGLTFSGESGTVNIKEWFEETRQDRYITSNDGLKLHAYYCGSTKPSSKYVIACHGYTSKADDMGVYAKYFTEENFSVLMPDARAHGQSEGNIIGMGWPERLDILKWINTVIEENPSAQIVLYGISMGAATVMMTSGEDMPDNVKAVVEDCGYSSVFDELKWQANTMAHMPAFPLVNMVSLINEVKLGYSLKEASAVSQLKKSRTPTLFIHGSEDWLVDPEMVNTVYNALDCDKDKLIVDGAAHAASSSTNPELYWSTIFNFISQYVERT